MGTKDDIEKTKDYLILNDFLVDPQLPLVLYCSNFTGRIEKDTVNLGEGKLSSAEKKAVKAAEAKSRIRE